MYDEEDDIDILFEEELDYCTDKKAQQEDLLHLDPFGHARYYMWNRLFEEWGVYPFQVEDRRKAKRRWCEDHHYVPNALTLVARENLTMDDIMNAKRALTKVGIKTPEFDSGFNTISFSNIASTTSWDECCNDTTITVSSKLPWYKPIQEKETNMGYEYNMEVDQRNHLKRRLDEVERQKGHDALKKYHMTGENLPKTKDALLAALAKGQVEFSEYYWNKDGTLKEGFYPDGTFTLADPDRDEKGYESACALLKSAYVAAKDAIIVKPLADGLTALNEFEAKEF